MRQPVALILAASLMAFVAPSFAGAQDSSPIRLTSSPALARADVRPGEAGDGFVTGGAWHVELSADPAATPRTASPLSPILPSRALSLDLPASAIALADGQAPQRRPVAFEYSDAYQKRRKIHVYSSIAMLPLFVTQYAIGDSLYNESTDGKRTAHAVIGAGIGALFGINTVTGAWNLWEGRKDPAHRTRRMVHGIMMLAADAGFVATALSAPSNDGTYDPSTHKAIAITSMGIATASYLYMLLTR